MELKPRFLIFLLGLFYVGLGIAFSQITPFNKGPDEGYHLEYITFIKEHGRLPINYQERATITRADFPPLYHLLVALISFNVNIDGAPYLKYYWDSFRYQAMDHHGEVGFINTEDYQWPYMGRFLVWQMGRWLSIGLSLATLMVVFLTLREILPNDRPMLPLFGTALLAFIPQYIFLSSSLNDDNLLGLLAALYFLMVVKIVKSPERWQPFIYLAILLGLSLTVKYTLIVMPLEIGLICWLIGQQKGWAWAGQRIALVASLTCLSSSWWFGWTIYFFNTVKQDGLFVGLISPLLAGGSDPTLNRLGGLLSGGQVGLRGIPAEAKLGTFSQWVQATALSFWGVGIGGQIPFYPYAYGVISLIILLAIVGLWQLWQLDKSTHVWLGLMSFHVGVCFILPLIRFGLSRRLGPTAQGRHILIPAATAVAVLLAWGLASAIPRRWQRVSFTAIIISFMIWTGAHLYSLAIYRIMPLPMRTFHQAADWPNKVKFGNNAELVSTELNPHPEQGTLQVNLAWHCLTYTNQSQLLSLALLNSQEEMVSYWIGYNGQGRLPSISWSPGEVIFDRIAMPLPNLPNGAYTLQIRLSDKPDFTTKPGFSIPLHLIQPSTFDFKFSMSDVRFSIETHPPNSKIVRYPSTISIVTDSPLTSTIELLDPNGQAWPPVQTRINGIEGLTGLNSANLVNPLIIVSFIIGPRWPSGDYRLKIVTPQRNEMVSPVLLTVENWWPRHFEVPKISVPQEANFANQLNFLGYDLPQKQVKAGQAFPLTMYWQARPDRAPQADFIQFNNLLDSTGTLRGGYDRKPLEYYNTLLWVPGEVVIDGYAVPVKADAPPGQYYLDVGYYLVVGESAVNLPLVLDGKASQVSSVTIGPIEVVNK